MHSIVGVGCHSAENSAVVNVAKIVGESVNSRRCSAVTVAVCGNSVDRCGKKRCCSAVSVAVSGDRVSSVSVGVYVVYLA
jgi:hypothetical protein